MEVKFKRLHGDAVLPTRANNLDAGFDLYAAGFLPDANEEIVTYRTGLSVAIPEGHVGLIFPRSSIYKYNLSMSNSVGVIDSGYRGEVQVKFRATNGQSTYIKGDRIAQLIVMPLINWQPVWAEELPASGDGRGTGGFGSSGA
jgi:dUTP pyrophosphatase